MHMCEQVCERENRKASVFLCVCERDWENACVCVLWEETMKSCQKGTLKKTWKWMEMHNQRRRATRCWEKAFSLNVPFVWNKNLPHPSPPISSTSFLSFSFLWFSFYFPGSSSEHQLIPILHLSLTHAQCSFSVSLSVSLTHIHPHTRTHKHVHSLSTSQYWLKPTKSTLPKKFKSLPKKPILESRMALIDIIGISIGGSSQ